LYEGLLKTSKGVESIPFAYIPGNYPAEINPPEVNYDYMFEKSVLKQLNAILESLGLATLKASLITYNSLI
jgi:hypothetical protein